MNVAEISIETPSAGESLVDITFVKDVVKDNGKMVQLFDLANVLDRSIEVEIQEAEVFMYTNSRGKTYYLHARKRELKSGKVQTLYFFAKEEKEDVIYAVPDGYEIFETKSGLPVLKRSDKSD
jgi:hypothetical protein